MTEKLQNALNEQITAELWSANLYLSMSFYLEREGFSGMARWMQKQSAEEIGHAYAIAEYMIKREFAVFINVFIDVSLIQVFLSDGICQRICVLQNRIIGVCVVSVVFIARCARIVFDIIVHIADKHADKKLRNARHYLNLQAFVAKEYYGIEFGQVDVRRRRAVALVDGSRIALALSVDLSVNLFIGYLNFDLVNLHTLVLAKSHFGLQSNLCGEDERLSSL